MFTWSAMGTWLEEDEVVHVHPRNPYVRVDALSARRHVRVILNGEVVADSRRPVIVYETGLSPRYYLPLADVRMELMTPTATESHDPYKGSARYWTLAVGEKSISDVMWGFDTPLAESQKLARLVCFWPEKSADLELTVDGSRIGQS